MNADPPAHAPAPAEESQAPTPLSPPTSEQPGRAAGPARSRSPLVAIIAVVVILIVAVLGYGVGGFAYAQGKLNSAQDTYNTVVGQQNSLSDAINSLNDSLTNQLTGTDVATASSSIVAADKTAIQGIVTKSQAAQSQIDTDQAALANADSSLNDNSWLTLLKKPDIDKAHTRIGHLRKALSDAKTITADYVQLGTFYQALFDVVTDLDDVGTKAQARDLSGASVAAEKLRKDTEQAISDEKAPGLPAEVDTLLQAIKSLDGDFAALFAAVQAGDSTATSNAETGVEADAAKLQAVDYSKIRSEIENYYKPLISAYNSEVERANST